MKKIIIFLTILLLSFSICACSDLSDLTNDNDFASASNNSVDEDENQENEVSTNIDDEEERLKEEQAERLRKAREEAQKKVEEELAQAKAERELDLRKAEEEATSRDEAEPKTQEETPKEESNISNNTNTTETMVWIPKTGKKYHSNYSCSGMKNPTKVSISSAESRGYTPCKNCY